MLLATIATIAALVTPDTSCAVIDNRANVAAFTDARGQVHVTGYTDVDRIRYAAAPRPTDNRAWRALHAAERKLQQGEPGPKIRLACRR